jgi:hypothetical protein
MDLGWAGLTSAEQTAAIHGGTIGFGAAMATYALFGFRHLRHRRPKRRRKARKGRR